MKKIITDGWHKWGNYDLYTEGGRVLRGTTKGRDVRTVYPYKRNPRGGWDKGTPLYSTLRRSSAWKMM
jgi:hypothetical protein